MDGAPTPNYFVKPEECLNSKKKIRKYYQKLEMI